MATFADYLATGRGRIAFSFQIEGCKYEFVTDPAMEGAIGDGRYRVRGLLSEGIQIQESVYMAGAELNVSLSSLQITETDGPYRDAATEVFTGWTAAASLTWLAPGVGVAYNDTDILVMSSAGITVGDRVHVGTEVWRVTAISPGTGISGGVIDYDAITVARGQWLTTGQGFPALSVGPAGSTPNLYEVTSEPASYAGRRVWLRGHGVDEMGLADAGTVLFRGILGDNPTLTDSRSWSIAIEPRTKLLDAEIGQGGPGGTTLRGIYYPGRAPLVVDIYGYSSSSVVTGTPAGVVRLKLSGFFVDSPTFMAALQALIEASFPAGGTYGTFSVRETIHGQWSIYVTTNAADPRYVAIYQGSAIDGANSGWLMQDDTDAFSVSSVLASHEYRVGFLSGITGRLPQSQVRRVPRANYCVDATFTDTAAQIAAYPHTRFYLSSVAGLTTGTMTLTPPKINDSDPDPEPLQLPISTVSGLGYVQVADTDAYRIDRVMQGGLQGFGCSGTIQPTFDIAARYGAVGGCNLGAFLSAIVAEAPNSANVGTTPWLTTDDIDTNAITLEVLAASSGAPYLALRDYVFSKRRKLSEILTEEWKLHGMFLCLNASGQIIAKRFPQDLSTTVATIDATTHAPGDDFGSERLSPDGIVTEVDFKLGYIPADDKWATEWNFPRVQGAATAKSKGQKLTISPFVRSAPGLLVGSDGMNAGDADAITSHVLGWFGSQYYVITVPVSIEQHDRRLGDSVLVTIPQLPKGGARGSTTTGTGLYQTRATVVGRMWQYGDSPTGTLDLFVHGLDIAGYAPSARLDSATGSGTAWALLMESAAFGDGTVNDMDYFAAGYKVVLREHDSESPERLTGTVTSVTTTINVTFDTAWAGPVSGRVYILGFGAAQDVTAAQRTYDFLADPMGRIQYSASTAAARDFS